MVRIGRITSIPIEKKHLQVVILVENWLQLGDPGTYTGDVVWLGMHDRRGGEYDADRQMIKVYNRKFLLCYFFLKTGASIDL